LERNGSPMSQREGLKSLVLTGLAKRNQGARPGDLGKISVRPLPNSIVTKIKEKKVKNDKCRCGAEHVFLPGGGGTERGKGTKPPSVWKKKRRTSL